MWQRFSERARMTVFAAQTEAQRANHAYVGTEHLLLGVLAQDDSTAVAGLRALGIPIEALREAVTVRLEPQASTGDGELTLTPRGKRAIDLASEASLAMGDAYIGTEHLLLGLVRERDGLAGRVLVRFGVAAEILVGALPAYQTSEGKPSAGGLGVLPLVSVRFGFWYGRTPDPPLARDRIRARCTPSSLAVLDAAHARAVAAGVAGTGAGHLMLALLDHPACRGMRTVAALGVDLNAVRRAAEEMVGRGPEGPRPHPEAFDPSGDLAFAGADVASRAMGNPFLGTEHLALVLFGGLAGEFVDPEVLSPIRLRELVEDSQSEDA